MSSDEAEGFWSSLDEATRRSLEPPDDGVVLELRGRFVDPEDARDAAMWRLDYIEYVNAHAERGFFVERRVFHMCRAHADARRVAERGVIPPDFACPLGRSTCPLTTAVALGRGRALVLEPTPTTDARLPPPHSPNVDSMAYSFGSGAPSKPRPS